MKPSHTITGLFCALAIGGFASAAPLTGSGPNLPIPSPNPGAPTGQANTLVTSGPGFTGTWTAPVLSPWIGTYSAFGPIPSSNANPAGFTRYDFTTLPTGVLPVGTYFWFGDVDGGSTTTEQFILNAYDSAGALINTPWLDEPFGVNGTGLSPTAMPGWNWDAGTSTYTIDGTSVVGNPSIGVWMESNTGIARMDLTRTSNFANFNLWAPVPTPATSALFALGALGASRRRR